MGRNRNKGQRSAARGKAGTSAALQAGGRPMTGSRKDTGLPAFFKQRRAGDARKSQDGVPHSGDGGGGHGGMDEDVNGMSSPRLGDLELLHDLQQQNGVSGQAGPSTRKQQQKQHQQGIEDGTFEFERAARELALNGKRDSSAKAFMREVKGVIDNSDVILQILDARDPLGSRSRQTEVMAMGNGKRVVLVLNKVDLIPTFNLQAWLRYLRNDFPTLAFKSSTQQQRSNLKQGRGDVMLPVRGGKAPQKGGPDRLSHGSESIGATTLLQLLKNYARTSAKGSTLKQQLTVGVVGPPNVGKSSLINSLLRTRACAVASTPGWTKVVQGVMLEKGIRLLDCPGVVLGGIHAEGTGAESSDQAAWSVLRNTVKVELIEDPIAPIQAMLRRVNPAQLVELYSIEGGFNEGEAHDFLLRVALLRGKLGKGGVPDLEGAARIVLHDWNIGKIAFHTTPPAVHPSLMRTAKTSSGQEPLPPKRSEQQAGEPNIDGQAAMQDESANLTAGSSLVTGFSEAFDLDALLKEADAEVLDMDENVAKKEPLTIPDGAANGKYLITPRQRRYATAETGNGDGVQLEAIEEDDEGVTLAHSAALSGGDTTLSTLGKRRRGMDEMASSDGESSDEGSDEERVTDLGLSDDDAAQLVVPANGVQDAGKRERQRQDEHLKMAAALTQRERELLQAFSHEEVAGIARRRGDARKATKKNKKRLRKSGAGLVDAWDAGLALDREEEDGQSEDSDVNVSGGSISIRSRIETPRQGLFDVLDQAAASEVKPNERTHDDIVQEREEEEL